MWGNTFVAFIVLPGEAFLHHGTVTDQGSLRTVDTTCGMHATFPASNGRGKRVARPQVFTAPAAEALTSGTLRRCDQCERNHEANKKGGKR